MEINQMLKRQEHFFQSQKTKKYEFRKKALLRLECAIKQHEEDMEHALYKDLGKSSFESYMAEIGLSLIHICKDTDVVCLYKGINRV